MECIINAFQNFLKSAVLVCCKIAKQYDKCVFFIERGEQIEKYQNSLYSKTWSKSFRFTQRKFHSKRLSCVFGEIQLTNTETLVNKLLQWMLYQSLFSPVYDVTRALSFPSHTSFLLSFFFPPFFYSFLTCCAILQTLFGAKGPHLRRWVVVRFPGFSSTVR